MWESKRHQVPPVLYRYAAREPQPLLLRLLLSTTTFTTTTVTFDLFSLGVHKLALPVRRVASYRAQVLPKAYVILELTTPPRESPRSARATASSKTTLLLARPSLFLCRCLYCWYQGSLPAMPLSVAPGVGRAVPLCVTDETFCPCRVPTCPCCLQAFRPRRPAYSLIASIFASPSQQP